MGEYKELEELINGYITDKNIRVKKLRDSLDQATAELDQVTADCDKALMGDDEDKYASLKIKKDMLTARKAQAQSDLDKLENSQVISEETYTDLVNQIKQKQRSEYWDCKRKIAEHYNMSKAQVQEAKNKISEGNRLLFLIGRQLYVKKDRWGNPTHIEIQSTVDVDMIIKDMRDALGKHYAGSSIRIV